MGVLITVLVFGLPVFLIMLYCSSSAFDGNIILGFIFMIASVCLVAFLFESSFKNKEIDRIEKEQKRRFNVQMVTDFNSARLGKVCYVKNTLVLFDKTNERIRLYHTKGLSVTTISFKEIVFCMTANWSNIEKICYLGKKPDKFNIWLIGKSVYIGTRTGKTKTIKSDDKKALDEIYSIVEYIITKGTSMHDSPFSSNIKTPKDYIQLQ